MKKFKNLFKNKIILPALLFFYSLNSKVQTFAADYSQELSPLKNDAVDTIRGLSRWIIPLVGAGALLVYFVKLKVKKDELAKKQIGTIILVTVGATFVIDWLLSRIK